MANCKNCESTGRPLSENGVCFVCARFQKRDTAETMYEAIDGFLSAHDRVLTVCQNAPFHRDGREAVDFAMEAQQKAIAVLRQALAKARGEAT